MSELKARCYGFSRSAAVALLVLLTVPIKAKIPDRSRVLKARIDAGKHTEYRDNGHSIEGQSYRLGRIAYLKDEADRRTESEPNALSSARSTKKSFTGVRGQHADLQKSQELIAGGKIGTDVENESIEDFERQLGQFTGCCYTYKSYDSNSMCALYGNDCSESDGGGGNNKNNDGSCSQEGLSFIGVSFSVNTPNGNPFSYQLCDQFPMENIIDRNYDYVMSMDEDGWLVGGGYKSFDYSGKMPYIDSSHTELLRIGSLDVDKGGTSINLVYQAMKSVSFAPIPIYPEYLKSGGGHHSGDDSSSNEVPSCDVTLIVSVVEVYDDDSYSIYEQFLNSLFSALDAVGGGPCMDDHDTDPHVSMSRGVKFKSSYHQSQYLYKANLEVSVWQAMYPKGVVIGSKGYASFPPGRGGRKQYVGYGNLYFFFDRANITQAFAPSSALSSNEAYYSILYTDNDVSKYYSKTTSVSFDYSGSQDNGQTYEHNPYSWKATMAKHDMTTGWDLPPNCNQEGETFFGIPLSRKSGSNLQSTSTFQEQFDFETVIDRNYTYIKSFGTNHGWLVGEQIGNGAGSIVDKDTAHIPLFYTGTTNTDMGGISLSNLIKVAKHISFGTLYIKPAFVFIDEDGHVKLQFEADSTSAMGYLYDSLCKELGIPWNYVSPSNTYGVYTNCAMHAAGDRATYGCGPDNANTGGFCPQMTIAYSVKFQSADLAVAYLSMANTQVDYWRSLYPSGVGVGTSSFCPNGGCLGLFLNRYDLYTVFIPELGGSWVEYHGASRAPTFSPAPTWSGGCNEPHNMHLDKCWMKRNKPQKSALMVWDSLGPVGRFSLYLVAFMTTTLVLSLFVARARKKRKRGESYLAFFLRDTFGKRKKKRRIKKQDRTSDLDNDLGTTMLNGRSKSIRSSRRSQSRGAASRSTRSKSKGRLSSRSHSYGADVKDRSSSRSHSHGADVKDRSSSRSHSRGDPNMKHRSSSRGPVMKDRMRALSEQAVQPSSASHVSGRSRRSPSRSKTGMMDLDVISPQDSFGYRSMIV